MVIRCSCGQVEFEATGKPIMTNRVVGRMPPVQMRVQTRFKPEGAVLPKDAPAFKAFPSRFIIRLLLTKLAMLLGL
jgi:hypothetical protein